MLIRDIEIIILILIVLEQHDSYQNGTEELLAVGPGEDVLDFRQIIELRQRQYQADPSSAFGYDVVSNLSGNYTCIASNSYGFQASHLPIQIHGKCEIDTRELTE